MKKYSQFLRELPSNTVVFAFGRFNPPTTGHELLVKAVKKLASQNKAAHAIYASKSQDAKKNPLTVDKKVHYLKLMFPGTNFVAANPTERTFMEAAKALNKKYKNIIMVAGSDRIADFEKYLNLYNGKEFNFDTIQVISAGERDPDSDDATGMSASKMRAVASKGDYSQFKKGLPSAMREIDGRRLMNDVRLGMGLEIVKEQLNLVKDELREQYFHGEIFNIGDIVESAGVKYEIVKRGSNHLLLKEESGKLVSKWIQDVTISIQEEIQLEESMLSEKLTDKTLKSQDKIKVARVIATMLGIENAESSANPEMLINNALRKVRSTALNPSSISVIKRMLTLASSVGIKYDNSLLPSKLKEAIIQPNGTDKISVTTGTPAVKKGIMRLNDYVKYKSDTASKSSKLKESEEVDKDSKYNIAKGNLSRKDYMKLSKMNSGIIDDADTYTKPGHSTLAPHHDDSDRRRRVKYQSESVDKNNPIVKEYDGLKKLDIKSLRDMIKQQYKIIDTSEFKTKEHAISHLLRAKHGNKKVAAAFGLKEESELDEAYEVCPNCSKTVEKCKCTSKDVVRNDSQQIGANNSKGFDAFFEEDQSNITGAVVDMSNYENDYNENMHDEEISDEELDAMADEIQDMEHIIDVYDDDEIAIIDDETGEELEETEEEKSVNEQAIMEVLSRIERMRAKVRIRRTKAKRERATKIALKRYSSTATINKRARRLAVKLMKKRLLRGRDATKISVGEKERVERVIQRKKNVLGRLALRLAPRVRNIEKSRMAHTKFTAPAPTVAM